MEASTIFKISRPLYKTIISVLTAGIVLFIASSILPEIKNNLLIKLSVGWIGFALPYLIISWLMISKSDATTVNRFADKEDGSIAFVFLMVLLASLSSLVTVLLLVIEKKNLGLNTGLFLSLAIASLICSWLMVHTLYTTHYARLYYREDKAGLSFPEGEKFRPDYMDFAYFSFCIGSTFQVSDVEIKDRRLRQIVLFHSLLSFAINTFVIALTINMVSGLVN